MSTLPRDCSRSTSAAGPLGHERLCASRSPAAGELGKEYATADNLKRGWRWTTVGTGLLVRDLSRFAYLSARARVAPAITKEPADDADARALAVAEKRVPNAKATVLFLSLLLNTVPITFLFVPLLRSCFPGQDEQWLPSAFSERRLSAAERLERRNARR